MEISKMSYEITRSFIGKEFGDDEENVEEYIISDERGVSNFQPECNFEEKGDGKAIWLENQVKLLISLYKKYEPQLGQCLRIKTKKKMWTQISEDMRKHGHLFSEVQVESKWKSLERGYKSCTKNNNSTRRTRSTCAYQEDLDEIFQGNAAVYPDYVLGAHGSGNCRKRRASDETELDESELLEYTSSSNSPTCSSNTPPPTVKQNNKGKKKVMLERMLEQQQKQFKEKMKFLKDKEIQKREARIEKIKQFENRTAAIQRKNDLLEKFLLFSANKSE